MVLQIQYWPIILYFYTNGILKTVFIIRHAKSDQRFFGNDFERPLNERGRFDAPMMAKRLFEKNIKIDALVASPAVRAKKTAVLFSEILQMPASDIIFISALYHAPAEVFYDVIAALPDNLNTIALFSHNPGITYFVNSLSTGTRIDNMPTCAIFSAGAAVDRWSDFRKAKKDFLFFDQPKNS